MYNFEDEKRRQTEIAAVIRRQYEERGESDFEKLRRLDKRVRRPPEIMAYTLGIAGALLLGVGMCIAMQVIGTASLMPLGIVVGLAGIAIAAVNCFIYKSCLKKRRRKYAEEVSRLSDKLLNG